MPAFAGDTEGGDKVTRDWWDGWMERARLPVLLRDLHTIHIDTFFEPPSILDDFDIITTHLPLPHHPILRERPVLQPITPLPLHAIVRILVLVPELHRNLISAECEELLAQLVVVFFVPLPGQEGDDFVGAGEEFVAVAPDGVDGVAGFGDVFGISGGCVSGERTGGRR